MPISKPVRAQRDRAVLDPERAIVLRDEAGVSGGRTVEKTMPLFDRGALARLVAESAAAAEDAAMLDASAPLNVGNKDSGATVSDAAEARCEDMEVEASGAIPATSPAAKVVTIESSPEQTTLHAGSPGVGLRMPEVPAAREIPPASSQLPSNPIPAGPCYDHLLARSGQDLLAVIQSLRGVEISLPPVSRMIFGNEYKRAADDLVKFCHSFNALASHAETSYSMWAENISADSKKLVEDLTVAHEAELRVADIERDANLARALAAEEELARKEKQLDELNERFKELEVRASEAEKEKDRLKSGMRTAASNLNKAKSDLAAEKEASAKTLAELATARKEASSASSSLKDYKAALKVKWERKKKASQAEMKAREAASNLSLLAVVKTGALDMDEEVEILHKQEAEGKNEYEEVSDPEFD